MELILISFIAGILTILAPCILPLLPVIIGSGAGGKSIKRPIIITLSLALSIILFTLILKFSTAFILIPDVFWKFFSAIIIFIFAISLLFPLFWIRSVSKISSGKIKHKFEKILFKFSKKESNLASIILGMSLGPVFASCSPTYFLILSTVLPASFFDGLINLVAYSLGLAVIMFLVAFAGQKIMKKLNIVANPNGWFKKILGILFLVVAVGIATGYDKKFETFLLDFEIFSITTNLDQSILDNFQNEKKPILELNKKSPELQGLTNWINSDPIESIESLKGKVVLVDFWTYSCVNCIRTLSEIQRLQEKYSDKGLVILGIHSPEFAFEKIPKNVRKAVEKYSLTYPVVQDNNFETWKNFENRYWPAKYLIDKDGFIRYTHFGEGGYKETEDFILNLLEIEDVSPERISKKRLKKTPETYLGLARRKNFKGEKYDGILKKNEWSISGNWKSDFEKIFSKNLLKEKVEIKIKVQASEANLVMGGNSKVKVFIDGKFHKEIKVERSDLYNIFNFKNEKEFNEIREVSLEFTGETIEVFAWTFG